MTIFFDHSRHKLRIRDLKAPLDVLVFDGDEYLSQPFSYRIEFTSSELDIAADQVLGKDARFSLHAPPSNLPAMPWAPAPEIKSLRTLHGVVTAFNRLSDSIDEARYEITLQPRLALLDRGRQYRIYQHQSVPEIVEHILRSRHDFESHQYRFKLAREYPRREQVMQYGESDLTFIARLLAEVGIWYRFSSHERLAVDVVEFHDDQRHYQFNVQLPYRPPAGLSSDQDGVWALQTSHQVVERHVNIRAYHHRDIHAYLDGEIDQTRGTPTTYGEAYHYAEPYTVLGDRYAQDEDLQSESGHFYARLRHERYLNHQTRLSGTSSSATLAPGQVLKITDGAPQAFALGAVITHLKTSAARDRSFECSFHAIPYSETICFRPPLLPKPKMAGTVPARLTSPVAHYPYAEIDSEGRYRVSFMFDRDTWQPGEESLWLRLARPYAGDTYGLHLPLIPGTEVAVAFEQGDPDRPYIAHALHDNEHPDHVTLENYRRNVLRTPANNKLRMEDDRGREHVKLSTEHSGKSQLNLGHLVDAKDQKRGEGFELRTDGWGAVRGGKGLLISADEQTKASGEVLDMKPATSQIEGARQQMAQWQAVAQAHHSRPPAIDGLQQLQADAKDLTAPAILLSAPKGIGVLTPASLLFRSGQALYLQSKDELNLAAEQHLSAHARKSISLLAQREGMRLVSAEGPMDIESHGGPMNLIAQQDINLQSVQGHLDLTALKSVRLGAGDSYINVSATDGIQIVSPIELLQKGNHVWVGPDGKSFQLRVLPNSVCEECLKIAQAEAAGAVMRTAVGG
ncbi:MAG TPA: type VI secretion system tip protein VgrG [Pseudomonas sp.]|nr:type VI secretion system tip protein VgrG [Pseudomonas sp.]